MISIVDVPTIHVLMELVVTSDSDHTRMDMIHRVVQQDVHSVEEVEDVVEEEAGETSDEGITAKVTQKMKTKMRAVKKNLDNPQSLQLIHLVKVEKTKISSTIHTTKPPPTID